MSAADLARYRLQSLQDSLNSIFLTIGNAYYEANKLPNKSQAKPISIESSKGLRQCRTAFLDSLDQIEIMVIRATEVLERRARQQSMALPSNQDSGASVLKDGEIQAERTAEDFSKHNVNTITEAEHINRNHFGFTGSEIPVTGDLAGANYDETVCSNAEGEEEKEVNSTDLPTLPVASQEPPGANSALGNSLDEDIMNMDGPIDFGEMDFDHFNFGDESGHFDFESMMED